MEREIKIAGMTGLVKWFSEDKHYGFIIMDHDGEKVDVFFHQKEVAGRSLPAEGDDVKFDLCEGRKGKPEARNILVTRKRQVTSNAPYHGKPYYRTVPGNKIKSTFIGGLILAVLLAWIPVVGSIIGWIIGGFIGYAVGRPEREEEVTSKCLSCGGIGQVTAQEGNTYGFQCRDCKKFWRKSINNFK